MPLSERNRHERRSTSLRMLLSGPIVIRGVRGVQPNAHTRNYVNSSYGMPHLRAYEYTLCSKRQSGPFSNDVVDNPNTMGRAAPITALVTAPRPRAADTNFAVLPPFGDRSKWRGKPLAAASIKMKLKRHLLNASKGTVYLFNLSVFVLSIRAYGPRGIGESGLLRPFRRAKRHASHQRVGCPPLDTRYPRAIPMRCRLIGRKPRRRVEECFGLNGNITAGDNRWLHPLSPQRDLCDANGAKDT
ncbi:hypothetical protein EVAR_95270_1 [Eumeta japonica]|uniref:Uncharacterized protein n=1 Tax=Eumeta variegata TaxID=151549 RepID=A0A4C1UK02_EUMVA|nr:hypothetical protein EVAR_95270_1 [Eumeta japonica]